MLVRKDVLALFITGALFQGSAATMDPLFSVEQGVMGGIMMVIIMVPFMFVGFDVIPQAAEEINLPFREIGRVLMISVIMAVFWYAFIILGTALMLDLARFFAHPLAHRPRGYFTHAKTLRHPRQV